MNQFEQDVEETYRQQYMENLKQRIYHHILKKLIFNVEGTPSLKISTFSEELIKERHIIVVLDRIEQQLNRSWKFKLLNFRYYFGIQLTIEIVKICELSDETAQILEDYLTDYKNWRIEGVYKELVNQYKNHPSRNTYKITVTKTINDEIREAIIENINSKAGETFVTTARGNIICCKRRTRVEQNTCLIS